MMMKDIQDEIMTISEYLTQRNQSFKQMIYQALSTMTTTKSNNNIEDLQQTAILISKILLIQIYNRL
jgi:hypothetical protein